MNIEAILLSLAFFSFLFHCMLYLNLPQSRCHLMYDMSRKRLPKIFQIYVNNKFATIQLFDPRTRASTRCTQNAAVNRFTSCCVDLSCTVWWIIMCEGSPRSLYTIANCFKGTTLLKADIAATPLPFRVYSLAKTLVFMYYCKHLCFSRADTLLTGHRNHLLNNFSIKRFFSTDAHI